MRGETWLPVTVGTASDTQQQVEWACGWRGRVVCRFPPPTPHPCLHVEGMADTYENQREKTGCVSKAYALHLSMLVFRSPEKRVNVHRSAGKKPVPGFPRCLPTRSGRDDAEAASARPCRVTLFGCHRPRKRPRPPGRLPEATAAPGALVLRPQGPACPAPRPGRALAACRR